MSGPGDALEVINALRLGWYVAEVRGRRQRCHGWAVPAPLRIKTMAGLAR
jgi:hypothetical protein